MRGFDMELTRSSCGCLIAVGEDEVPVLPGMGLPRRRRGARGGAAGLKGTDMKDPGDGGSGRRRRRVGLPRAGVLAAAMVLVAGCGSSPASASPSRSPGRGYLYWSNNGGIGRARVRARPGNKHAIGERLRTDPIKQRARRLRHVRASRFVIEQFR